MGRNYQCKSWRFDFCTFWKADKTRAQLSALRMELATRLGLRKPDEFAPLWVVDFPLLEWDEESGRWHAMHHPFTSPKPEDMELISNRTRKSSCQCL
jgi:aspartyl-tRNA synthetase